MYYFIKLDGKVTKTYNFHKMDTCENHLLKVNILTDNINDNINPSYSKMFTQKCGFSEPNIIETKCSQLDWIKNMTPQEENELYSHYLVWKNVVDTNTSQVVIYNDSNPVNPVIVTSELIKITQNIDDVDIVLYGKYLDRCDKYVYNRTVTVRRGVEKSEFNLYKTCSPYGSYAYLVNPCGAQILLDNLCSKTVDKIINKSIEKDCLNAITYHPSIIRLSDDNICGRNECRDPLSMGDSWGIFFTYLALFLLLGILIGLIVYFIVYKLSNHNHQYVVQKPIGLMSG